MDLAVVTHFAQGWSTQIIAPAELIGVQSIRDGVYWEDVEKIPGVYEFSSKRVTFPNIIHAQNIDLTLLFASSNPLYDAGTTPHTPEAVAAFARFVLATLREYPWVRRIEIGNEFNAQNFVSGEVRDSPYTERAGYHARLVAAVDEILSQEFSDVEIIGGAMHSIPVGYAEMLVEAGAMNHLDGIAFHPYTSPPEQLASHIDMLRATMGDHHLPLYVTEFSQEFENLNDGPGYLVKMTSVMAAEDVQMAIWYALREQPWYKGTELLDKRGLRKPAADAYDFISSEVLPQGPARRLPSDPFTHLYIFGESVLVAWGEPRDIELPDSVEWYDARGRKLDPVNGPRRLDRDMPLVAISSRPLSPETEVVMGPQALLGDSFFQFDPRLGQDGTVLAEWRAEGTDGGSSWTYLMADGNGNTSPLATMPGGERQDEAWRPYVGHPYRRPLSISENSVVPVIFGEGANPEASYSIIERFHPAAESLAVICGRWQVSDTSSDGISIQIINNGDSIFSTNGGGETEVRLDGINLTPNGSVDFIVGSNINSDGGDSTERSIEIYDAARAPDTCPAKRAKS